jgi:sugar transferase (PEP-CTERM/EpsH1 system associated)
MPSTTVATPVRIGGWPSRGASAEKLRVLHVFNYLGLGGTELTAMRVVTNLGDELFESHLCGLRGFDSGVVASRYPGANVVVPERQGHGLRLQLFNLMKLIKSYQPQIVHSRNWGAIEAVPAARLSGVPVVIHSEHGYELDILRGLPARRRAFRRAVYGMADAVFTVTDELRVYHARQAWISPDRISVIANGIDLEVFAPRPEGRPILCQKLGIPEGRFVFGSVGRVVLIKDHAALLRAAEVLHQRGIDVHVLLAGSGPELIRHQKYVKNSDALSGRVSFIGAADNVAEVLNAMDVFVLPSISEGMSNTLLEAMACGLPVIATRVGGNPEVVEEDRSGWLFTPGDVVGLAERLERLANGGELRQAMGKAARARIVSKFSMERMVSDYRRLYLHLAEKRGVLPRRSI